MKLVINFCQLQKSALYKVAVTATLPPLHDPMLVHDQETARILVNKRKVNFEWSVCFFHDLNRNSADFQDVFQQKYKLYYFVMPTSGVSQLKAFKL